MKSRRLLNYKRHPIICSIHLFFKLRYNIYKTKIRFKIKMLRVLYRYFSHRIPHSAGSIGGRPIHAVEHRRRRDANGKSSKRYIYCGDTSNFGYVTRVFPHLYTRAAAADVGRNCGSICLSLSPYCTRLIERRGNIWTEKRHHGHQQRETQISRVCRAPVCASKDVSCTHCRHMITLYRRAIQVRIIAGKWSKRIDWAIQLSRWKSLAISHHIFKRRPPYFYFPI